jgi:NAD(P)H-hydrate epimerase
VLAIGPGLGKSDRAAELVLALLASPRRIVLDADGLNILAASKQALPYFQNGNTQNNDRAPTVVLTPHPGEYQRLADAAGIDRDPTSPSERPATAAQLAAFHQAVVLLKGNSTLVADNDHLYTNTTGNVALATAGSGDILTGIIASLIAQGMLPYDAARLSAHVHGKAADLWAAEHGDRGLTALELAQTLPQVFKQLTEA